MRNIFLFVIAMASAAYAEENSCSDIDLNKEPTVLATVPRWEQGDTQLCYAFTTAQLVDAYRIKKGDLTANQFTSPLLLASQTIKKYRDKGTTYKGGKIEHAFSTAREIGICNSKYVSDRWGKSNAPKILSLLKKCYERSETEEKAEVAKECIQDLLDQEVTRDVLPTTGEFVKYLENPKEEFISDVLSSQCKEKHSLAEILPSPHRLFRPRADSMGMVEKINQLLGEKTPIGVNFCAEAVSDKNHVGRRDDLKREWICQKGLRHSAIIAGRKNIDGKCHFLIRDTGCEALNKNNKKLCEGGQYFIEENHLVANSEGLIWLE